MININDNYELYSNNIESLRYAGELEPIKLDTKMIIHYYWRVPLDFGRKQAAVLKSAIVNNYLLNGDNLEINLWSNVDLSNNIYLQDIKRFINIKIWDPIEEIKGTILEPNIDYYKSQIRYDGKNWIAGDFFRLLCLHKYGGFYFDFDVMILRDISPLNKYEFLYQWGSSGTTNNEPNIFYNGACMRLNYNSSASRNLLTHTLRINSSESTAWSSQLYSMVSDSNLHYFPCAWFNTEWCLSEPNYNFDPFKVTGRTDMHNGAFTWHWHNRWLDDIEDGSKFQLLESDVNKKFNIINEKSS